MARIAGRKVQIDTVRHVFVGYAEGDLDTVFVEFKNSDGELTRLRLSKEAADALASLLVTGGPDPMWQLVDAAPTEGGINGDQVR